MGVPRRSVAFAIAVLFAGCRSGDDPAAACEAPYVSRGDTCAPRLDRCGPDAVPRLGGGCDVIGVPKDGCAEGFVHDGAGGCAPVLPPEPCAAGKIAVPGDTVCRELSACGDGPFGAIATESDTLFVDGSVTTSGDGSRTAPLKTINEALAKVRGTTRPIVAVAAGTYLEDLVLDLPVRLRGRCAAMVEVRGTDSTYSAVEVHTDVELRGVAITGPGPGVVVTKDAKATIEDVWVHGTARWGITVDGDGAPGEAPATIRNVLVEDVRDIGIWVFGGAAIVEKTAVRDIRTGIGVRAELYAKTSSPGRLELRGSLVERAREAGVASLASRVDVFGTAVRDTLPRPSDDKLGAGYYAAEYPKTAAQAELNVVQSWASGDARAGVYFDNSRGRVERTTVVRGRGRASDGRFGNGAHLKRGSAVDIVDSLFADNRSGGITISGSTATIERTIVRDTSASTFSSSGFGIAAFNIAASPSSATIRRCLVARARNAAISIGGSSVVLEDSALIGTLPRADGLFGDGFTLTAQFHGDGVLVPASGKVLRTLVADAARAGVLLDGATLELADVALECNGLDLQVTDDVGTVVPSGARVTAPYSLSPTGPVTCGCGATVASCRAQQSSLSPTQSPEDDS